MAGNKHYSFRRQTGDITRTSDPVDYDTLLRSLLESVKSLPIVDLESVQKIQHMIERRCLRFDDDKVAEKFLELEAIFNG